PSAWVVSSPPPNTSPSQPPGSSTERPPHCNRIYITLPTPAANATTMKPAAVMRATGAAAAAKVRLNETRRDGRSIHPAARGNTERPKPKTAPMIAPAAGPPERMESTHVAHVPQVTTNVDTPTPSCAPKPPPYTQPR